MAHSWQYSRYRRAIMQVVMWVVLGGTVGLAALQTRQKPAGMAIYPLGPWRVRVPEEWTHSGAAGKGLEFHEPNDPEAPSFEQEGGRTLVVQQDHVDPGETPVSYLAHRLHLEPLPNPQPIPMCGQQGVIFLLPQALGDEEGTMTLCAGTVMPNGDAVRMKLRVPHRLTQQDLALAEAFAGTIMYQPTKPTGVPSGAARKPDNPDSPD